MTTNALTVLQVNKLYHPWVGGIETAAADIAEYLNQKEGVRVVNLVCQARGQRRVDHVNGVKTYRASSWGMFAGMPVSLDFFRLFKQLASSADLIILHHPFPLAFVAYRYLGLGKKSFVWYHSDIIKQRVLKIPFMPSLRFTLGQSAGIIVSNRSLIEHSKVLRNVSDRCGVIHFGLDERNYELTPDIQEGAEYVRRKYGSPLILSVGRLVYYKGFEYLIKGMKEIPNASLVIVGSGPLRQALEQLIKSLELQERVHIIDSVDDLRPYYHACDVFAFPSCEPSEVFGIVQIEAMACGKPVINTALPTGVPEVSIDQRTGCTVPPKNPSALAAAIRNLLEDKDEYDRMSQNALREVSARFSKRQFFEALDSLIDSAKTSSNSSGDATRG